MRWIVGIVAALVCLGWIACQIDIVSASAQRPRGEDGWRRTVGGWERLVTLKQTSPPGDDLPIWKSHPHPLVATLMLIMLSLLVLVAFTDGRVFTASGEGSSGIANSSSLST